MKVVINRCFGGFELSQKAEQWLAEKGVTDFNYFGEKRSDPFLVECVETLGKQSWGCMSELKVVEIPDEPDLQWEITEYDGIETIEEVHRRWY